MGNLAILLIYKIHKCLANQTVMAFCGKHASLPLPLSIRQTGKDGPGLKEMDFKRGLLLSQPALVALGSTQQLPHRSCEFRLVPVFGDQRSGAQVKPDLPAS